MERTSTVSLAFLRDKVEGKPGFGANVHDKLVQNASKFPNLPIAPDDLNETNNVLVQAIGAANSGDHQAVAAKMNAEKKWDQDFRATAKYVGSVANGDEEVIRAGGFVPTKSETTPAQAPGMVADFEVSPVKGAGKALVESAGAKGATGYVFMAKTAGVTVEFVNGGMVFHAGNERIYIVVDTHKEKMLEGLQSDVRVAVSLLAFNRAGEGPATPWQEVNPQ